MLFLLDKNILLYSKQSWEASGNAYEHVGRNFARQLAQFVEFA